MRESIHLIRAAGATPCGVLIALDRQERVSDEAGQDTAASAVQHVQQQLQLPVVALASLHDLLQVLGHAEDAALAAFAAPVQAYRDRYGV